MIDSLFRFNKSDSSYKYYVKLCLVMANFVNGYPMIFKYLYLVNTDRKIIIYFSIGFYIKLYISVVIMNF